MSMLQPLEQLRARSPPERDHRRPSGRWKPLGSDFVRTRISSRTPFNPSLHEARRRLEEDPPAPASSHLEAWAVSLPPVHPYRPREARVPADRTAARPKVDTYRQEPPSNPCYQHFQSRAGSRPRADNAAASAPIWRLEAINSAGTSTATPSSSGRRESEPRKLAPWSAPTSPTTPVSHDPNPLFHAPLKPIPLVQPGSSSYLPFVTGTSVGHQPGRTPWRTSPRLRRR